METINLDNPPPTVDEQRAARSTAIMAASQLYAGTTNVAGQSMGVRQVIIHAAVIERFILDGTIPPAPQG